MVMAMAGKWRCLNISCRKTWNSELTRPEGCPWCGTTNIIKDDVFWKICDSAMSLISTTPLGMIPSYDAFLAIISEYGLLSTTPRFRRALLLNVLLQVQPNCPLSLVVSLLSQTESHAKRGEL